ncbi:hypothetical protein EHZ19_05345 [Paraburkholderia bannensis]|nr:hypothetical protein [Paraburkholderia bannensis]RQM49815.1 hypothetical protein EHZ19_05345 [Paraburkholderia bannensis]
MDDTQHSNDLATLNIDQIRELSEAIRDVFGRNLSRTDFTDKLLMFLEDVAGYESGEVAAALIELAWVKYGDFRRGQLNFSA